MSAASTDPVAESLDAFAARRPDPAAAVNARLFARHPEAEALLDGGARLDGLIAIERMNHVNIGVPKTLFDGFLGLVRDAVREALGEAWTPAMAAGWAARLEALGKTG